MHILIGILGAAAAAIFFIYRVFRTVRAGRQIADEVGDPRRFMRKVRWTRKVKGNPLDRLDDPREAATLLMLAVARTEDELTETARAAIHAQMRRHFQMSDAAAEAMCRQMAWMTRDMTDISPRLRRLVTLLQRYCTPAECVDLTVMMQEVAEACGGLTPMRRQIVQRYRQILKEQDA